MLKKLLTSTILTGILALGSGAYAQDTPVNTTETVESVTTIGTHNAGDVRQNAEHFLQHINYARVAIALKDIPAAKTHLASARELVDLLKTLKVEERKITRVESGRVVYEYETTLPDHYFPLEKVETGPVEVKTVTKGPFWAASNSVAVTDAEIVYLTLDLSDDRAEKGLAEASTALNDKDPKKAQSTLETLVKNIVRVDSTASVPLDKAVDNIALTRNFIAAKNYDGARYSLKHADNALDAMEDDSKYASRKKELKSLRKQVSTLQTTLKRKDPTTTQQVSAELEKLWAELKKWANE